jgi:glucose-6-phosphate 1-epimerase
MDRDSGVSVRLTAPAPPAEFGHKYKLAYVVTLTAHELVTDIHITNQDDKDFIFQTLLHSYLAVPDSSKLSISGLDKGLQYFDKADGGKMKEWDGSQLKIEGVVDR